LELAELPSKEMKLTQINRVIGALQTQYEALVSSMVDARITRSGRADWNVILLSPASEAYPIRVNDYVRLAILPLFSLVLGIGLAFLVDSLDHSIKDAGDVETYVGLPVLSSVSPIGGR
jgi:capsular polysaccharide biosynthesis protein